MVSDESALMQTALSAACAQLALMERDLLWSSRMLRPSRGCLFALFFLCGVGCASEPPLLDGCEDGVCDRFIEPSEESFLYIARPALDFALMVDSGADGVIPLSGAEADSVVAEKLGRYAVLVGETEDVLLGRTLAKNFDSVAMGAAADEPIDATHRLIVQVRGSQSVVAALLPNIKTNDDHEVEVCMALQRTDGAAAPMEFCAVDADVRGAVYAAYDRLVAELGSLPVYQWRGLGHMGQIRVGSLGDDPGRAVLSNAEALFDENVDTRATLRVEHSRIVDQFLYVFGGDYEFDPVYMWLAFDEPTVLRRFVLDLARGNAGRSLTVLASNLESPEAPKPDSGDWAVIAELQNQERDYSPAARYDGLHDVDNAWGSRTDFDLDSRKEFQFRHIAVVWQPARLDDDGTHEYILDELNLYLPPEMLWKKWYPPVYPGGGGGGGCFTAGTKISTPSGLKNIEDVAVGDAVWSFDTATEKLVEGKVTRLFRKKDYPNGIVTLADGRDIHATPDHPFFRQRSQSVVASTYPEETSNLEVVFAEELAAGDVVYVLEDGKVEGKSVAGTQFGADPTTVYNFTVDATHSYFAEGVLVHNR